MATGVVIKSFEGLILFLTNAAMRLATLLVFLLHSSVASISAAPLITFLANALARLLFVPSVSSRCPSSFSSS